MEPELFFVGIKEHTELRKDLLLSSKNILDSLKRYEHYRAVKEDKLRYVIELKRVFDELLLLNKKLRGKLPKVPVKTPTVGVQTREDTPKSKILLQKPRAEQPTTKLELLEQELAKVEERLGKLE